MLKKLQWFELAMRLRDFLLNYTPSDGTQLFNYLVDREHLKIKVGSGNMGEFPAIWILFSVEEDIGKQANIVGGKVQLYIKLFVKGGATRDDIDYDDSCYRQLYQLEQDMTILLAEFQEVLKRDYGIAAKIDIPVIYSDGDENAPVTAEHGIIVNVEWYRTLKKKLTL